MWVWDNVEHLPMAMWVWDNVKYLPRQCEYKTMLNTYQGNVSMRKC